jgi:microcystin-dependent protein
MTIASRMYNGGTYTQAELAEMFASFITDGYCLDYEDELEVTAQPSPNMTVNVSAGMACIQDYWYENDGLLTLTLTAASGANPRIDRIILRLETGAPRQISAKVLTGTPAGSPTAPGLTQNSSIWELSLAQIYVEKNAVTIDSGDITDERNSVSTCGISSSAKSKYSELLITQNMNVNYQKLIQVADPALGTDGLNKEYCEDNFMVPGSYGENKCEIAMCAGTSIPSGWLECNGASLLRATYPDLFAAFGTTFGSADGSHFNLPDMRGRCPYGATSSLGTTGGEKTHQLSIAEMPAHTHSPVTETNLNCYVGGGATFRYMYQGTKSSSSTGGGTAHNNLHPYIAMKWIVRAS